MRHFARLKRYMASILKDLKFTWDDICVNKQFQHIIFFKYLQERYLQRLCKLR